MSYFKQSFCFIRRWPSRQEVAELLTSKAASSKTKIFGKTLKSIFEMTSREV